MTVVGAIKEASRKPRIAAVLASLSDLQKAARMRRRPDFFELRLDALRYELPTVRRIAADLGAPIIITARHPAEGGVGNLSASTRRALLEQFLPHAALVDIELRDAVSLGRILNAARCQKIKCIISVHQFQHAPSAKLLTQWAHDAQALGADIFKIVTRTETAEELAELLQFFEQSRRCIPTSAMGVGRFGRKSRIYCAQHGSALNYVHLGNAQTEGQLSLPQMRHRLAT
jgi:3-dehydroquinate dehydratase-1